MKINSFLTVGLLCLLLICSTTFAEDFDSNFVRGTKIESESYEYPLMVGKEADVKEGMEYIIEDKVDDKIVYYHIVIPKDVGYPDDLTKMITYKGKFSKIINIDEFKYKKPKPDYQYFLVESWEYE